MGIGLTTLFSLKGGTGKSSLSMAISLDCKRKGLDVPVLTNDRVSIVEDVLGEDRGMVLRRQEDFPEELDTNDGFILDLGGFLDERISKVIAKSKNVVVPTVSDYGSLQATITTINDLKSLNKNIIIILNRIDRDEFLGLYEVIRDKCGAYPIFPIKNTKAFENSQAQQKSIWQMMKDEPRFKRPYGEVQKQLEKVLETLEK